MFGVCGAPAAKHLHLFRHKCKIITVCELCFCCQTPTPTRHPVKAAWTLCSDVAFWCLHTLYSKTEWASNNSSPLSSVLGNSALPNVLQNVWGVIRPFIQFCFFFCIFNVGSDLLPFAWLVRFPPWFYLKWCILFIYFINITDNIINMCILRRMTSSDLLCLFGLKLLSEKLPGDFSECRAVPCARRAARCNNSLLMMPEDLRTKTRQCLLKVLHTKTLS